MSDAVSNQISRLDHRVSRAIAASPQGDELPLTRSLRVLNRVSQTGSYGVGWVVLFAAVVGFAKSWQLAAVGAACVIGTLVLNTGIKTVIRRPRPTYGVLDHSPTTYSMPSAHTSMAVVGAAIMTHLFPDLAVLWWVWSGILALSRIVLGVHFVGDVVVGGMFGAVLAWLVAVPLIEYVSTH